MQQLNVEPTHIDGMVKELTSRGIPIQLHQCSGHIQVFIYGRLMDEFPKQLHSEADFTEFAQSYKKEVAQGNAPFKIPAAKTNLTDEFIYRSDTGDYQVLSDFSGLSWFVEELSDQEKASGVFYLKQTNDALGTLLKSTPYTLIRFNTTDNTPTIKQHQTSDSIKTLLHEDSDWMQAYLEHEVFIFDETKQIKLTSEEFNPDYVRALNDNSAYTRLPYPLTKKQREVYFTKKEMWKQFGYSVNTSKAVPSVYTINQTPMGEVWVTNYYHLNRVPQHFFCKCGSVTATEGPLSERICLKCLAAYQQSGKDRTQQKLTELIDATQQEQAPSEKAFVVFHTNRGVAPDEVVQVPKQDLINVCVLSESGDVLFEELIKPEVPLTRRTRKRGYRDELFENARSFSDVQPDLERHLQGKTLVFFGAEQRTKLYNELCLQHGVLNAVSYPTVCLKDALVPLAKTYKRVLKLQGKPAVNEHNQLRELAINCLKIEQADYTPSIIQADALLMRDMFCALLGTA